MNENQELPPLPEPDYEHPCGATYFTPDQMQAYAKAALAAKVPVGWKLIEPWAAFAYTPLSEANPAPAPEADGLALLRPACRFISDVLASDTTPSEKHIARTLMHLLPLTEAAKAPPAQAQQAEPLISEALLHAGKCATYSAKLFNEAPADVSMVEAGDRLLRAAQLLNLLALAATKAEAKPLTEPTPGLLMSMAMRYDHGLGMPGFYDSEFYKSQGPHAQRVESTLRIMRQLWEEVAGQGFYAPEQEAHYAALAGIGANSGGGNA